MKYAIRNRHKIRFSGSRTWICVALSLLTASCLKDDGGSGVNWRKTPVSQFVSLLKSGKYNPDEPPPVYEISDIPELLKYSRDEQVVTSYPMEHHSTSSMLFPKTDTSVGMTVLWMIEATRLDVDYPSPSPVAIHLAGQQKAPLNKVADLYEAWWKRNNNKTASELKKISPFEGTDIVWR